MKQEDKELLLRDLCGRLPYSVKCQIEKWGRIYDVCIVYKIDSVGFIEIVENSDINYTNIERIKPYLFPMSSMTDIQKEIYKTYKENLKDEKYFIENFTSLQYWLYANHFDVNKLIEKGLAIDATGLNIY